MMSEREAIFQKTDSRRTPDHGEAVVRGPDLETASLSLHTYLSSLLTTGFTATALGRAILEVKRMREWHSEEDPALRCKIFLGYTSNQVSSGNREVIRFLVKHRFVDVLVTTAGGIEEDFIKCLAPSWVLKGTKEGGELRRAGINRIGNLMIPNDNYCAFEDWVMPILDAMSREQVAQKTAFTPSMLIDRLGREVKNEESIYWHAHRNGIPVFSPAITDGSLGDMLYFHSFKTDTPLVLDIVQDVRALNLLAVRAPASGVIVLGGGLVKHHILNANLMRNGADFAVYINTAHEFDGSDAGASPDEAVSWGKIKATAEPVKVCCDATIAFPLLVAGTFYEEYANNADAIAKELGESLYI